MIIERTSLEPGLSVVLHTYDLPLHDAWHPAWTLVTSGLSLVNQREVALTILRTGAEDEAFPRGVLEYIPALKRFAAEGHIVRAGDISGYRAPGPFQLASFVGLAFFDAPAIPGVELADDALTGLFLTEGELAMASRCSVSRVLNRLGKAARHFPAPHWTNPLRPPVYTLADVDQSILTQMSRAVVSQASATLRGDVLSLSIPRAFAKALAERTASGEASAVLPRWHADTGAALVWSVGQREPEAIIAEGTEPSAFAATFVALVPNDAAEDEIRFMEDGYAVVLSVQSKRHLVDSLQSGTPYELRDAARGRTLRVIFTA
jgi:hypothetical protein